jgi:hypothetical protein
VIFIAFAERIIGIFTSDPAVLPFGGLFDLCELWLRFLCVWNGNGASFQRRRQPLAPTFINFSATGCSNSSGLHMATKTSLGANGVFLAIAISNRRWRWCRCILQGEVEAAEDLMADVGMK